MYSYSFMCICSSKVLIVQNMKQIQYFWQLRRFNFLLNEALQSQRALSFLCLTKDLRAIFGFKNNNINNTPSCACRMILIKFPVLPGRHAWMWICFVIRTCTDISATFLLSYNFLLSDILTDFIDNGNNIPAISLCLLAMSLYFEIFFSIPRKLYMSRNNN